MQTTTQHFADAVVVTTMGRVDHLSAAAFEEALTPLLVLTSARGGSLVLDLSGVDYISSVGLRVLMIAAKQLREPPSRLLVAALQGVVAEIFAISRFDRVLSVCPNVDAAMQQCSAAAQAAYQAADKTSESGP